jgi:hypothetical protein
MMNRWGQTNIHAYGIQIQGLSVQAIKAYASDHAANETSFLGY